MKTIVLVGAPSSGKSTLLERLPKALGRRGLNVARVGEAARFLLHSLAFPRSTDEEIVDFQRAVLDVQLAQERWIRAAARNLDVVLFDRGAPDGAAFLEHGVWQKLLEERGLRQRNLIASYDAVIFLRPPSCYALDGIRKESPEAAMEQHERLRLAWSGHPMWAELAAYPTIEERVEQAADVVGKLLGKHS